jgi:hypothetical protein
VAFTILGITIDEISFFENVASVLSAFGIIIDIYNLVMYIIFGKVYFMANPLHQTVAFGEGTFLDTFDLWLQASKEESAVFQRALINILVHFGMTVFSVLHGPLSVSVLILTLFFTRTQLEAWSSFPTVSTIVMLISCALAILMIGIPYVSNLSIDKIFNR